MHPAIRIAWGSLGVSITVLALKSAAFWLTGSVALYSDALETVINVVAAGAALAALRLSAMPADANHPYGHHKAEYLSAVVEGALVLFTALVIARQAWLGWQSPRMPDVPLLGLALNAFAGAANLGWASVMLRAGRRWKSPALSAGGRHVMADVWTTAVVLAGFALVPLTGWLQLDSILAGLIALNVLWSGSRMLRHSIGGLMDEVADPGAVTAMHTLISIHATGALEAHDVRTRTAGRVTFVEFHLVVPSRMAVEDAHRICDCIEQAIRAALGEAVIHIHVEPESKAKHHGVVVLG